MKIIGYRTVKTGMGVSLAMILATVDFPLEAGPSIAI